MNNYDIKLKQKRRNKKYICHNCDKPGHDSKSCKEPVTSWGIVLVKFDDIKCENITHDKNTKIDNITEVKLSNDKDIMKASLLIDKIKFLMVSRKHSLGYIEFIMGRYSLSNIDHLTFLIQQMLPSEIKKIKENINNFRELWTDLWGDKSDNPKHATEYLNSMELFKKINNKHEVDIKLEFLLDKIEPLPIYKTPELGFPKGRKNRGETSRECAIREFVEESGYNEDDIKIIDEIQPITEILTGTNGVRYRHIYYLAELVTDKKPSLNGNECQKYEIGSVDFYTYNDAKHHIRPYHVEKMSIITKLFFYYLDKLMCN